MGLGAFVIPVYALKDLALRLILGFSLATLFLGSRI